VNASVTVLIPTFNRAQYLAECLDSLLTQTLPPEQVIVVNDGSTDATRDVLKPYRDHIDYVETDQLGKPGALNEGLKHVRGEYLWIFDDDDVALPDALERMVAPLHGGPEYGFSFAPFHFTASDTDNRIGEVMHTLEIPDLKKRGFLIPLLESNFLGGAALFARTACYDKVGRFDPALLRSQDYDMAIRIARAFEGVQAPGGATFHYRQHDSLRGSTSDRFEAGKQRIKWLEYDQKIFRRLYVTLPLSEYLPPGTGLLGNRRQAHLQRLKIMASKSLWNLVMKDLHAMANLGETAPLTGIEEDIIQGAIETDPFYGADGLYHHEPFFRAISQLAPQAEAVRRLRAALVRALPARWRSNPAVGALDHVKTSYERIQHMYPHNGVPFRFGGLIRDLARY
jgi:glycosyltransferase involved in cell wall biosynthesis